MESTGESLAVHGGDVAFMRVALEAAREAARQGEVPVGAVVVVDGKVVSVSGNRREGDRDPFGHAELIAMRAAAATLGRWRLSGATVFVTLEPCPMCAGALVNARVDRLVFGAADPKAGATGSLFDLVQDPRLNHRVVVESGVLAEESSLLLRRFFSERRRVRPAE